MEWEHRTLLLKGKIMQQAISKSPRERGAFFPGGSVVKNLPTNAGDVGLIPGLGRSPGEENGNPLQYSCLENPMTEEPVRLQSMWSQRVRCASVTGHTQLESRQLQMDSSRSSGW